MYVIIALIVFNACNKQFQKIIEPIDKLNEKAYNLKYSLPDSAINYAEQALNLSNEKNYKKGIYEAYNNLGYLYFLLSDFYKADSCFNCAISIGNDFDNIMSYIGKAKIELRTCNFIEYHRNIDKAYDLFLKNKVPFDEYFYINSEIKMTHATYDYYKNKKNSAYTYLKQIDTLNYLKNRIKIDTSKFLNQKAYIEYMLGCTAPNSDSSLFYYKKSLLNSKRIKNLYFEANSLEGLVLLISDTLYLSERNKDILEKELNIYVENPFQNIGKLYEIVISMFKKYGDPYQIAALYSDYAKYNNYRKEFDLALRYLDSSLFYINKHIGEDIIKKYDSEHKIMDTMLLVTESKIELPFNKRTFPSWLIEMREQLFISFLGKGMMEEYKYNYKIFSLINGIIGDNKEIQFNKEKNEQEQKFKEEKKSIIIVGIISLVSIILGIIYIIARRIKKEKDILIRANNIGTEIIFSKEINSLNPNFEIKEFINSVYIKFHALFKMDILNIGLFKEEKGILEFPYALAGVGNILPPKTYYLKNNTDAGRLAVRCFERQGEVYIRNYYNDKELSIFGAKSLDPKNGKKERTTTVLYLPLNLNEKHLGVISIQTYKKRNFSVYERLLFKTVSSFVAIAIDDMLTSKELIENKAISDTCFSIMRHDMSPLLKNYIPESLISLQNIIKNDDPNISPSIDYIIELFNRLKRIFETIPKSALRAAKLPFKSAEFCIQEVFEALRGANDIVKFEKSEYKVNADQILIEIVLRNLIQNARNAIKNKDQGEIKVWASEYKEDSKYIQISVKDNGIGISKERLDGLFNMEDSANEKPGFGLILCNYILSEHSLNTIFGCKIWASSKEGFETIFSFILEKR
jgi:hypothetical protein